MSRWQRFLFATDFHGDQHDPKAADALLEFKKTWKPHVTVFGGDLWDFRALRKGASEEDKHVSLMRDYRIGLDFLHKFKPNAFVLGNHDARLWYLAERSTGFIQDAAGNLTQQIADECRKMKCRMLPYHRTQNVFRLGRLKMLHGFFCGVNAARQHAQIYGSCLFGHVHTIDIHSIPNLDGPRIARSVGCLCDLDMEWDQTRPSGLRQAHGWAYGFVDSQTGNYKVYQAEKLCGQWFLPTAFEVL